MDRISDMEFQAFVNTVDMPCCVLSVEKAGEGSWGEIRIVVANRAYRDTMGPAYHDNMIYSELVPQDNKFEDYCYRAAVLKQRMHAYVETRALHCWTDQTIIPLASDREDVGYCQFIFEFTQKAEAGRMASVSIEAAEAVIKSCIQLIGKEDFLSGVGGVLKVIMEESGAAASRIVLVDHEMKRAVNFCERSKSEEWSHHDEDFISYELILSWEDIIGVSNELIITDEKDMASIAERNHEWVRSMNDNNVKSLVLIPLRRKKSVIGYLYVINFDTSKVVELKDLIELMSFFLGSEIHNNLLLKKLETISRIDALTGCNNRRAMIQRVRFLSDCSPRPCYGVVNIDLNGLKAVNDNEGHEAGDRLLIQVTELLGKVFYHEDVFRTGGDEFIILSVNIDREAFDRKLSNLHYGAEKHGLRIAVGSCWCDGSLDPKETFRSADERMYSDKMAYYDKNPGLKRH